MAKGGGSSRLAQRVIIWAGWCFGGLVVAESGADGHLSENEIRQRLIEGEREHDALYGGDLGAGALERWREMNRCLHQSIGLELGFAYTALGQAADTSLMGPRSAVSGDFDFYGHWDPGPDGENWTFALNFEAEWRHRWTRKPPSELKTGVLGGTVVDFNEQDPSLIQLFAEIDTVNEQLRLQLGKLDIGDYFGVGRLVTADEGFFSPAFSDSLPMALPENGFGAVLSYFPDPSFYLQVGVADANGQRSGGVEGFFDDREFFSAMEIGWNPGIGTESEGLYHATIWHSDSREAQRKPDDWGYALNLEQEFGPRGSLSPFLRYAWANRGLNEVKQSLAVGVGFGNILGQNDDLIGVAGSWMEPSDQKLRDQYVIELYYRCYLTPHLHVTPDIQFVFDPSKAPKKDLVTVFGFRMRAVF